MMKNESRKRGAHIVIVDDILPNALLAQAVLEKLDGVSVDIYDEASVALETCLETPPDLILLDLVMPGMDGLAFLRKFKERTAEDFIPVIVVTGEPKKGALTEAMDSGATDFLRKPWDEAELAARVRNMLSLRDSHVKLRLLATIDSLTGVLNRRAFSSAVETEMTRAQRYGNAGSFLMMDIDFFKKINDTYGHGVGDEALKVFAGHCRALLRNIDVLGRMGGEEFAAFLPETPGSSAVTVADRLRSELREKPIVAGADTLSMSVSIGVAEVEASDKGIDDLMRRADAALYLSKENGRDRVTLSASEPDSSQE